MIIWAIVILALSLVMVFGSIVNLGPVFQAVLSYLILLVALAIVHRVWRKTVGKRREILEEQLAEIRRENERLKERLTGQH